MSCIDLSSFLPFRPRREFCFVVPLLNPLGRPPTMTTSTFDHVSDDANAALREKLMDALVPGFAAEFDPDEAQRAGAFAEDALSEADAADSAIDLEGAWALHTGREV